MPNTLPQVIEFDCPSPETLRISLLVDKDVQFFKGHFENFAILPGVALIGWVVHFAHLHLGSTSSSNGLDAIKFLRPIFPDSKIHLNIQFGKHRLEFTCEQDGQKMASGRILLEGA